MKGKVIINNQEIEIEINEEQLEQLKIKKKTGYERANRLDRYYYAVSTDVINYQLETDSLLEGNLYDVANYYSDRTLAKNNARADQLMRQLRRFAVENRKKELDWKDERQNKYEIYMDIKRNKLAVAGAFCCKHVGHVTFDSEETAKAAIDKFKDELIWYFTEYKDSL